MNEQGKRALSYFITSFLLSLIAGWFLSVFLSGGYLPLHWVALACLHFSLILTFVIWTLARLHELHYEVIALRHELSRLKKDLSRS